MSGKGVVTAFAVIATGAALSAGAYWALLNVPESNLLALLLSATLVVLAAAIAAGTIGVAVGVARGSRLLESLRYAHRSFPGFATGLVVFAVTWWITTTIDTQWAIHRGEIDALFLRYAGTANTSWAHTLTAWLMWLLRWNVGLLAMVGAIAGSCSRRGAVSGLASILNGSALVACTLALVSGYWLWTLAYWRPAGVSSGTSEVMFVGAKLGVLACLGLLLAVAVIYAVARVPGSTTDARVN